jgi:hypothetical protein
MHRVISPRNLDQCCVSGNKLANIRGRQSSNRARNSYLDTASVISTLRQPRTSIIGSNASTPKPSPKTEVQRGDFIQG